MGPMDEWRYKIVGTQVSDRDEETGAWTPFLTIETEVIWESDMADEALDHLKDRFPAADFTIMRTRDKWEHYRD